MCQIDEEVKVPCVSVDVGEEVPNYYGTKIEAVKWIPSSQNGRKFGNHQIFDFSKSIALGTAKQ